MPDCYMYVWKGTAGWVSNFTLNPGPTSQAACLNSPIVGGSLQTCLFISTSRLSSLFPYCLLPSPSVPLY